ncbi:MAG: hypothetical protein IAF38_11490 [Bacteroidia bacterium]|nr:hypothetical protein [Bacteroidia bacterium]
MKIKFLLFNLILASVALCQDYRFISNTPFKVMVPESYKYAGIGFFEKQKSTSACLLRSNSSFKDFGDKALIDSADLKEILFANFKIEAFEKVKIGKYEAILARTLENQSTGHHLVLIYDKKAWFISASASAKSTADVMEQKSILLKAKFEPGEKPDAIKDAAFTADFSLIKNAEPDNENYPAVAMKFKGDYKTKFKISMEYKIIKPEKKETIAENVAASKLPDGYTKLVSEVSVGTLSGKEIIFTGKNKKGIEELNFRTILFDSANSFWILISFDTQTDIDKNKEIMKAFVKTLTLK